MFTSNVWHSLETFGLATAPPEPLETQILPPFLSPAWRVSTEGSGPGWAGSQRSVPFPAQSAQGTASVLGAGWEAVPGASQAPTQQNRKRPVPGGGERKEGAGAGERGAVRAPARNARGAGPRAAPWPRPGHGSPSGGRLRSPEGRAPVAAGAAGGVSGRWGPRWLRRCWRRASGVAGSWWGPAWVGV